MKQATEKTGVTREYKDLITKAGPLAEFLSAESRDIDNYITARALNGLFDTLALEEAKIRENPAARGTELLRRVFGSNGG